MRSESVNSIFILLLLSLPSFAIPYVEPQSPPTVTLQEPIDSSSLYVTGPSSTSDRLKCTVKKCIAAMGSVSVSCGLAPLTWKKYDGWLWCGAMTFNAVENLPTACTNCPILHTIKKYGPVAAAVGIGGALLYRNQKKTQKKIGEEATSLHEDVKEVKDAVKEAKVPPEPVRISQPARVPLPVGLAA